MTNAIKGILFSALIFPGAGQIILGKYLRGAVLFAVASVSGLLFLSTVVRQSVERLQEVVAQGGVVTVTRIMGILTEFSTYLSSSLMMASFFVLFCCWLFSTVDAWRIGRKLDKKSVNV